MGTLFRFAGNILAALLSLVAIAFAVSNLEPVSVALWPLEITLLVPLYLVALIPLVIGFLVGGLVGRMGTGRARRRARVAERAARRMERTVAAMGSAQSNQDQGMPAERKQQRFLPAR